MQNIHFLKVKRSLSELEKGFMELKDIKEKNKREIE